MSKFNKIYEYEYHLFGQVSEHSDVIKYAHMQLYIWGTGLCVLRCLWSFWFSPECDGNDDVSIRPFTGSGVQSTVSEVVS